MIKQKEFNSVERRILKYIFDIQESRRIACKHDNIFEGIIYFLEKIFFYKGVLDESIGMDFIRGFFVENKRYMKKYDNLEDQFEEFWRVSIKYADELYNKIRVLSNFNERDYYNLRFKTKLVRYGVIPFTIDKKDTLSVRNNLLKRFSIVFNDKREPTNDEMLKYRYDDN